MGCISHCGSLSFSYPFADMIQFCLEVRGGITVSAFMVTAFLILLKKARMRKYKCDVNFAGFYKNDSIQMNFIVNMEFTVYNKKESRWCF